MTKRFVTSYQSVGITALIFVLKVMTAEARNVENDAVSTINLSSIEATRVGNSIAICISTKENSHFSKDYGINIDTVQSEKMNWFPILPQRFIEQLTDNTKKIEIKLEIKKESKNPLIVDLGICDTDAEVCIPETHLIQLSEIHLSPNFECLDQ